MLPVTLAADDLGEGHPVVLLHAGIADRRMWRAQVPALTRAGHRVLALDLPGCGESGVPDAGFLLHAPVAETLAAHDVGRATLVGCSFGGRIALDLTLARPDLVDDHPAVRRNADHIAASIPAGRRLPDIPAAGHLPSLGAPEAVTRILLDALRGP